MQSFLMVPAWVNAISDSVYSLIKSATKLPYAVYWVLWTANRVSRSISVNPTIWSEFLYASIWSFTYDSSCLSFLSSEALPTYKIWNSKSYLRPYAMWGSVKVRCGSFLYIWIRPTFLKLQPLLMTGVRSTTFSRMTWSCPPKTISTPLTSGG